MATHTSKDGKQLMDVNMVVADASSLANTPFMLDVSMGRVDGYSFIDKFGINPTITTSSDPEDIWENGGLYTYDANGTAPIVSLASDSTSDTVDIEVQGLDIDGNEVTQIITLNGTTRVALTTPLWRVYRMQNANSTDLVGTVFCYTGTGTVPSIGDPEVRAIINGSQNQTLMSLYTIPLGKVGFLMRGELGVELTGNAASLSEYARCHYESRRVGKVFKIKKVITIFPGSTYEDRRVLPDVIPALTDIKLTAEIVTQTMGLWGTFDILLVDEDKLDPEFLTAIGQPSSMP